MATSWRTTPPSTTAIGAPSQFFDFATGRWTTVIRDLGPMALGLSVSRDGRTIYFTRVDSSADELMLVEHFR